MTQPPIHDAAAADEVPAEVRALEGVYHGSWTMFGLGDDGQVVPVSRWTDVVTATDATVEPGRAYVSCSDEMTFENAGVPPQSYQMTEGYLLHDDGHLGDYFIESMGHITRFHQLGDDTWAYHSPAAPQELAGMGFTDVIEANHVLVKVVTRGEGGEVHRNTRVTTINYRDAAGAEQWLQFVSLAGQHVRQAR